MIDSLSSSLLEGFGWNVAGASLGEGGVLIRAVVVYAMALFVVRLGHSRFFARLTPFDMVAGVILGSVFSRAINGSGALGSTLIAALAIASSHWLFALGSYHFRWFGRLVKGREDVLLRGGVIQWDEMRRNQVTERDLLEALRLNVKRERVDEIETARLERNGDISAIPRRSAPRVVEVAVRDGVQIVRLAID